MTITGPSTSSLTTVKLLNGNVAQAGVKGGATSGQCIADRFSVTNPGGAAPPTICGVNTGEHSEYKRDHQPKLKS
jgi:hypothetical protein